MKRSIFVATLALTPALLHAQATLPAQTSSNTVLQARFAPAVDIKAAAKSAPAAASTSNVRVSTGVVAPQLLQPVSLPAASQNAIHVASRDTTVVVTMMVDATGKPTEVAIAQSSGDSLDQRVLSAISQARFKPGTLDGQPFALPVRLKVVVEHGTEY
jgi:TonB family protein